MAGLRPNFTFQTVWTICQKVPVKDFETFCAKWKISIENNKKPKKTLRVYKMSNKGLQDQRKSEFHLCLKAGQKIAIEIRYKHNHSWMKSVSLE